MIGCKSIFVEKKEGFNVEGKSLLEDFKTNLRVESLENVRVVNKLVYFSLVLYSVLFTFLNNALG